MSNQTTLSRLGSFGGDGPTEADAYTIQPTSRALLPPLERLAAPPHVQPQRILLRSVARKVIA